MAGVEQQSQQKQSNGAALRAYLAGVKAVRYDIGVVLGSIQALFENLQADKLLTTKAVGAYRLRVVAAGHVVTLGGAGRRDGERIVPVISFEVDGRPVYMKLVHVPGASAWTWSESAGAGVDGLAISPETVSLVFLKLLSGEV